MRLQAPADLAARPRLALVPPTHEFLQPTQSCRGRRAVPGWPGQPLHGSFSVSTRATLVMRGR